MAFLPWSYNGDTKINDGENYTAYFPTGSIMSLADGKPSLVERTHFAPEFTYKGRSERTLVLGVLFLPGETNWDRNQYLKKLFNPFDDSGLQRLVIYDDADWNRQYYVEATPISYRSVSPTEARITLLVPDPEWRSVNLSTVTWGITASGQTKQVSVLGNLDAYPVYRIKPTAAKSGAGSTVRYQSFVTVYNQTARTFSDYPLDLGENAWDTAALILAGKMQVDGADIHVFIDGVEVDYWLDDIDTNNTSIWVNVSLQPQIALTVEGAYNATDTTVTLATTTGNKTAIARLPNTGLFLWESEIVTYTAKDSAGLTLTLGGRGAKGSTAATHADATTLYWLEHDITIVYGDASLTNYTADDTRKPIFALASSTNTSWDYDDFLVYDSNRTPTLRTAIWQPTLLTTAATFVTGATQSHVEMIYYESMSTSDPLTQTDPGGRTFSVMGSTMSWYNTSLYASIVWQLYVPSGVTTISADGNKYLGSGWWDDGPDFDAATDGASWSNVFTEGAPAATTVTAWSRAGVSLSGTYQHLRFRVAQAGGSSGVSNSRLRFEVNNVTLTLDSDAIPVIAMGTEQTPYLIDATLKNNTTGEQLAISYAVPDEHTLEIDTEAQRVTYVEEGISARAAVSVPLSRWDWLRLAPGGNTLLYTEPGAQGVTLTIEWRDRAN